MPTYNLKIPITEQTVRDLRVGDILFLSGTIFTARDMGHMKIETIMKGTEPLPFTMEGGVIFHAGPVVMRNGEGWTMNVIGPTTSIRMEPYAEMVASLGVKMIIGKGGMGEGSLETFQTHGQVYLQAPPGCAVKLGSCVKNVISVKWLDLGMPEALWEIEVENFGPLIVTMDSQRNSRYKTLREQAYVKIHSYYS